MKENKKDKLLLSAYKLFTTKGMNNTTIQDIVDDAKVAKGTFYIYFKDKYDIKQKLIIEQSKKLFDIAIKEVHKREINKFDEQIIFIIDYVIDEIIKVPDVLNFITKDLALGIYNDNLTMLLDKNEFKLKEMFLKGIKDNNIKLHNPEITLFMIIEFVSSTLYSVVTNKINISINDYKIYIHKIIKDMINGY